MANKTTANEAGMIKEALAGNRSAFGDLVGCRQQSVINVVYRMCGNRQLAEDAAQEAFIKAWVKLASYRPASSFRNWLYRIAVNTALDMLRRQPAQRNANIDDMPLAASDPQPENAYMMEERVQTVQNAVLMLPASSRSVLVLREYEGLSYQEIADMLDIPMGTVMSRLNYARNRLREILKPQLLKMEAEYA